ncbi:MAG: NAD-dependent epimerase/dehydratase family protein [Egibacteraceae bacterium]
MRVLVTGAGGFVGRVVVDRLAHAGHRVTALTRRAETGFPEGTAVATADLLDRERLLEIVLDGAFDGVCHLAALTRVRQSFAEPLRYFAVNVGGTVNLLDALARTGQPSRLVFASTGAVYGPDAPQPVSEDRPPVPANPYGASKLAAEQVIGYQAATGALGAASLRCFNVAGAAGGITDSDLTRLVPKALAVASGAAPFLEVNGDGSVVRELTHVADLADAYALALDAITAGQHRVFNVGGGTGVTINEVIAAVEEITGRPLPVRTRPVQNEPAVLVASSDRIRAQLGWQPTRSTLRRIVADAWACRNDSR